MVSFYKATIKFREQLSIGITLGLEGGVKCPSNIFAT